MNILSLLSGWLALRPKQISAPEYEKKIDISEQLNGFYGQHRSGWPYVLGLLARLHKSGGLVLDSFIERTFCWHPRGPRAHRQPWIGFIHVPPRVPDWFLSEQSNERIFASDYWQQSLPHLRGLFTLSAYHRQDLENRLDIPVENLIFPTETPDLTWTMERFQANRSPKIVQVGWWLRKLHTIFLLPDTHYKKIFLRISHADIDDLLRREREILLAGGPVPDRIYRSAEAVEFLDNAKYDRLLSENIVIAELYDASANNTVIECIVRNTPLLVNPLPAVREYLGEAYPFYFTSLEEAARKAEDLDLVYETHRYLTRLAIKEKLTGEFFLRSLVSSRIYQDI